MSSVQLCEGVCVFVFLTRQEYTEVAKLALVFFFFLSLLHLEDNLCEGSLRDLGVKFSRCEL